jgi:hypothetical protein
VDEMVYHEITVTIRRNEELLMCLFMRDKLILQLHPDKNRDDPDAEEKVSLSYSSSIITPWLVSPAL